MRACADASVTMTSANALPSLTFSCIYSGSPLSPNGNSMDLTADAAALFKAAEKDAQGGARWSSNTRPSEIIPTTMARNKTVQHVEG